MAIRVKTVSVTIPANGQAFETILSVPSGSTYRVLGLAREYSADYMLVLSRDGTHDIELPGNYSAGMGSYIPYNQEVEGPATLQVGGVDLAGSSQTRYFSIFWEE